MKRSVVLSMSLLLLSVAVVLGARDPYTQIEAETMDVNNGAIITAHAGASGGKHAESLQPGDHIGYHQLNFSAETVAFQLQLWNGLDYSLDSQVQLRLDSPTSAPFLTVVTPQGGARWIQTTLLIPVDKRPRGVHDLYFTFRYPTPAIQVLAADWFRFVTLDSLLPRSLALCPVVTKVVTCSAFQYHAHPTADHGEMSVGKHIVINIC